MVNLTLVDLPGLTKVAVEGQSDSIVADIEDMVRSYVEKPNSIMAMMEFDPVFKDYLDGGRTGVRMTRTGESKN